MAQRRLVLMGWAIRFAVTWLLTIQPVSGRNKNNIKHTNTTIDEGKDSGFQSAKIAGDLVLGGLFPVHEKGEGYEPCGEIQADRGIQRLEAMLFTIDQINKDKRVLPDLVLGSNILDTCSRDTYALEQSLEYVRASMSTLHAGSYECEDKSAAVPMNVPIPVVGVIGGSYSTVSIQVANLFRLFKIPQVSYASTSAALSDKKRFDFFARTVPPDNFQAKAMADIVSHFGWTYVSTIASEGNYGEAGIYSFEHEARARNICIAATAKIPQNAKDETFNAIIQRLLLKKTARVVVLFPRVEDARQILLAAKRLNVTNLFVWIASDGWGTQDMPVKDNELVAEGALTIELQSSVIPEFDDYFTSLDPYENIRNPWFVEFWEEKFNCKLPPRGGRNIDGGGGAGGGGGGGDGGKRGAGDRHEGKTSKIANIKPCTGTERISKESYTQETKIQFIYDAVYAMAHAVNDLLLDSCGHFRGKRKRKRCMKALAIDGEVLYKQYLLNVSFEDGYGGMVKFDQQGDGLGRYNVMNYRKNRTTRKFEYVPVGRWSNGLTMKSRERIMWAGNQYELPTSQCSSPCEHSEVKKVQQGESCCWVCVTCAPWEYVIDGSTCVDCGSGYWPTENSTTCTKLPEIYMQWDSVYAIMPICLSIFGFTLTLVVMVTFMRNINTPVVKASGRELSFMLLSGFLICYLMTFVLIAKPSALMCGIQRFGVGFGFSVTYASLLTKTNRISRIFHSASRSARRPPFISPRSQVLITLLLISVQIVCNVVWLTLERPGTRKFHPFGKREIIVVKCRIRDESFLISLIYNMLLIIVCTVYAVKTRKIPENFNESKFIGFTMYTTCIIWLAFIPIYFGTLNSFQIQLTTLCVSISLSAFVALLCLFTPKMYIIVFQPEKNVRKLTMNSATYKKPSSSISAVPTSNHGSTTECIPSEHIRLNSQCSPLKIGGNQTATMETETDNRDLDSLASLSN